MTSDLGLIVRRRVGGGLGNPDHRQHCCVGAALNAVYNDHNTAKATALCKAAPPNMQQACYIARDQAASTF